MTDQEFPRIAIIDLDTGKEICRLLNVVVTREQSLRQKPNDPFWTNSHIPHPSVKITAEGIVFTDCKWPHFKTAADQDKEIVRLMDRVEELEALIIEEGGRLASWHQNDDRSNPSQSEVPDEH